MLGDLLFIALGALLYLALTHWDRVMQLVWLGIFWPWYWLWLLRRWVVAHWPRCLRWCTCHVDVIFGRFHDHYCPRHGDPS